MSVQVTLRSHQKVKPAHLYVHIGLGKAGSSALQTFLYENCDILGAHGFCYPKPPVGRAHQLLAHRWDGGWLKVQTRERYDIDQLWRELRDHVARDERAHIISSERFTGATFDAEGVPQFIASLFSGIDTRIVVYLRPQEDLAESEFKQRIYSGRIRSSLADFITNLPPYFDYEALLRPWAEAFGTENVIVRRYSAEHMIEDFLDAVGIPRNLPFVADERRINRSISGLSAQLILALGLNNADRDGKRQIDIIRSYCDDDQRRLITDDLRRDIRTRFAPSNREVALQYLGEADLFN